MGKVCAAPLRTSFDDKETRCLHGLLHLSTAMSFIAALGAAAAAALGALIYFKFKKLLFIVTLPAAIPIITFIGIIIKRDRVIWPMIAVSFFHIILASYALLIFLYYFTFKPLYIIMIRNWALDSLDGEKTLTYYLQCAGVFATLMVFLLFNVWQAIVSMAYRRMLDQQLIFSRMHSRQPTVLVVNKTRPDEY